LDNLPICTPRYKDDDTILGWQTGNELGGWEDPPPPGSWTVEVAKFIKDLSPNVLVIDGTLGGHRASKAFQKEALLSPYVDVFDNHYYGGEPTIVSDARFVARYNKAFIIGEYGFSSVGWIRHVLEFAKKNAHVSGSLIWSLRFHSRDGGNLLIFTSFFRLC
jgi:hypothetical protein